MMMRPMIVPRLNNIIYTYIYGYIFIYIYIERERDEYQQFIVVYSSLQWIFQNTFKKLNQTRANRLVRLPDNSEFFFEKKSRNLVAIIFLGPFVPQLRSLVGPRHFSEKHFFLLFCSSIFLHLLPTSSIFFHLLPSSSTMSPRLSNRFYQC